MMDEKDFAATFDVSRETMDALSLYYKLLVKWNNSINLVAKSTLGDAWHRHFVDSAQLWSLAPARARSWVDIGSGGGFPGMVVAILAAEQRPDMVVTLVESDQRKATFLGAVARELRLSPQILAVRAELHPPLGADVLSARALASLDKLLEYSERHLAPTGIALFPKGEAAQAELDIARSRWRFSLQVHRSLTDPAAAILAIEGLSRV
jgi:16S rRNA (guanine527-N7)-methyltransferase